MRRHPGDDGNNGRHACFLAALQWWLCLPNLTDEDTEGLRGPGTCPQSLASQRWNETQQCLPGGPLKALGQSPQAYHRLVPAGLLKVVTGSQREGALRGEQHLRWAVVAKDIVDLQRSCWERQKKEDPDVATSLSLDLCQGSPVSLEQSERSRESKQRGQ